MTILLICDTWPPDIGGPSRQGAEIARVLAERGNDVHVCLVGTKPDYLPTGVRLHLIPDTNERTLSAKIKRRIGIAFGLFRILREVRPNVVHVQVFGGNLSFPAAIFTRVFGIPSLAKITAERCVEQALDRPNENALLSRWRVINDRLLYRLFARMWVTTPTFERILAEMYEVPQGKIFMLPNFTDLRLFEMVAETRRNPRSFSSQDPCHILTVCRLKPWKGIEDAIQALRLLNREDFRWTIVGSGSPSYEQHLRAMVEEAGLASRVRFAGAKLPSEVSEAFGNADLFLLPSRYEPFGIVLIEAMAAGLPIVASRAGGIPFVTDEGRSAILFDVGNHEQLAGVLADTLADFSGVRAMAEVARQWVRRFELHHGVSSLESCYGQMVEVRQ